MKIKPYNWQEPHIKHLIEVFTRHPYVIDASDTGTGKTICALFVAKALGQTPLVIAPKIVLTAWKEAAELVGIELLGVINPEGVKTKKCKYLTRLEDTKQGKKKLTNWQWNLKPGTLVIWDEAHVCGGLDSQNSRVLLSLKRAKLPCLMLSATIADDPLRLKAAGTLLGLHKYSDYQAWCREHGCFKNPFGMGMALMFTKTSVAGKRAMLAIHRQIFPEKGGRLKVSEIDDFPENMVLADSYDLPDRKAVEKVYEELEEKLYDCDEDEIPIVALLRARQNLELLKTPIFVSLTVDALEEGKSVAIFVSFKETLAAIEYQLERKGIKQTVRIEGGQTLETRDTVIRRFQANEVHVCLCMIQAGGIGISLHDLHGRPRESLISPPYSAKELKQVLGRIHRAGSLSKAVQKIVFIAGTVEETACKNVRRKLDNLSALNDGDLGDGAGF